MRSASANFSKKKFAIFAKIFERSLCAPREDFHDYLLIEQFLREYVRNVDWIHGGGCHSSRDRLFVQSFVCSTSKI